MNYGDFTATVRDRGEYTSVEEADLVTRAVLSTTADAVSGGELNQILSQLPAAYAPLFGKADLT